MHSYNNLCEVVRIKLSTTFTNEIRRIWDGPRKALAGIGGFEMCMVRHRSCNQVHTGGSTTFHQLCSYHNMILSQYDGSSSLVLQWQTDTLATC
jgi:hypothetical protein